MMKVSDPILFGHAVTTYFADVFAKHADTFDRIGVNANDGLADVLTRVAALPDAERARDRSRRRGRAGVGSGAGDGRLRPGHHQPARAERHHHRRVHAADDPRLREDVERGRRPPGHQGRHPRLVVRGCVRRGHRRLPRPRRVRPGHAGLGAERRAHGAAGRGVRVARQDVRDPRRRHRARREPRRRRRDAARGRGRRRVAGVPGEGRPGARLGRSRGPARPADRRARRVLARRDARARRAAHRQGAAVPARARHRPG